MTGSTRAAMLAIVAGVFLALRLTRASADLPKPAPLVPSQTVPPLAQVSGDDYYPLLFKWTQSQTVGNTALQVTYLDPLVIIAQIKSQATPSATRRAAAAIHREVGTFPRTLDAQVTYATANRGDLNPAAWHVTLIGANGGTVEGQARVTVFPTQQSSANGTNWAETVRYTFPNTRGEYLSPSTSVLQVRLSGPPGSATVTWSFGASAAVENPTGYVPYLGWSLAAFCVALCAALWLTRPPKELLA